MSKPGNPSDPSDRVLALDAGLRKLTIAAKVKLRSASWYEVTFYDLPNLRRFLSVAIDAPPGSKSAIRTHVFGSIDDSDPDPDYAVGDGKLFDPWDYSVRVAAYRLELDTPSGTRRSDPVVGASIVCGFPWDDYPAVIAAVERAVAAV